MTAKSDFESTSSSPLAHRSTGGDDAVATVAGEEATVGLCPRFHRAVELIGKRWTGAILRVLQGGRTRFNAIAAAIPDMSDRMLAERLRELEHEGILARTVVPESPVRVEYELTAKGRALDETLCALARWAEQWVERDEGGDAEVTGSATTERAARHE